MSVQLRPIFEIYLEDSRYAVPTLYLVPAEDVLAARGVAERMLDESIHHLGAELCYGGELLAAFGASETRPRRARRNA